MKNITFILIFGLGISACSAQVKKESKQVLSQKNKKMVMDNRAEAVLGAGCFWCTEAFYTALKGVISVQPGYAGGTTENPTYEEVCSGETGHAEVAKIIFDSTLISYDELLEVFWFVHNPTSLNKQGNDEGTQYRSVIFYTNDYQAKLAQKYKQKLDASGAYSKPIVTEIVPLEVFYPAENYHNDYFANHPEQGYCKLVIKPKVEKFKKAFEDKLKKH